MLPPSLNFERPNPNVDWAASPVRRQHRAARLGRARRRTRVAGVSAFGFGGTNFHVVMEEHVPGRLDDQRPRRDLVPVAVPRRRRRRGPPAPARRRCAARSCSAPPTRPRLANELRTALAEARQGRHLEPAPPSAAALRAPERIAIDYADGEELVGQGRARAARAASRGDPAAWTALRARGIYRGSGAPGKVAFLYTGQGSQYANMLAELRAREPVVADVFDEADAIMAPLLEGRRLSDIIFADPADADAMARAEEELRRTEITQPAVLTVDIALTRLLGRVRRSRPTSSWATRSASTARSSPPARSRSRPRWRP